MSANDELAESDLAIRDNLEARSRFAAHHCSGRLRLKCFDFRWKQIIYANGPVN
jgi:hypothetical protein